MHRAILILNLFCLCYILPAQNNIVLSFQAEDVTTGDPIDLDSVKVTNIDKACDTTLYGIAPVLVIDISTEIFENRINSFKIAKPQPNPFKETSLIRVSNNLHDNLKIQFYNQYGNLLVATESFLQPGVYDLILNTTEKITFVFIWHGQQKTAFKLINLNPSHENSIKIKYSDHRFEKSITAKNQFLFEPGDSLELTGFASEFLSDTILDNPFNSENYYFQMQAELTLSSVVTDSIINISYNSASGGGEVLTNGGSPVFQRGICWDTLSNPTIDDHFTMDGSGIGTFNSLLSDLDTNTIYYVKAYAINQVGVSYGNEVVFVTQSGVPCPDMPFFEYDGKIYHTVLIGEQCWMKENLDIGTMIFDPEIPQDNGIIEKWCYDNDPQSCNMYGGLYRWDEAMAYTTTAGAQGICPDGWHIPTDEEYKIMEGTIDSQYPVGDPEWDLQGPRGFDAGLKCKSKLGWFNLGNGNNLSGMNVMPTGYRYPNFGFDEFQLGSYHWSSDEADQFNVLDP